MIPFTSLDDWTPDAIRSLLESGGEPGWYDWKEVLKLPKEAYPRLCSVVSGMANTDGGYIVFGVKDNGATIDDRIVGIELSNEDGHSFGQAIVKVRPDVRFTSKTIRLDEKRGVFVVHIPQSQRRPHMNQHDKMFYQRGDGGNAKPMEYQQVRDLMLLTQDRLRKVKMLQLKVFQYEFMAGEIMGFGERVHECLDSFDTQFFDMLVMETWSAFPDSDLLHKLMVISKIARRINNALALAITPDNGLLHGLEGSFMTSLRDDLSRVKSACKYCGKSIATLFGPLDGYDPDS